MAMCKKVLSFPFRYVISYSSVFKQCTRTFTNSQKLSAYDPDGKTTANILNNEDGAPMMINSYSMIGFRLNLGIFVVGPVALFPKSILSWNVKDDFDINERSLSLFLHLAPKLDVLIIGLSDARNKVLLKNTQIDMYKMMSSWKPENKINIEVLPTEKAVTTFNFLNAENRFVGAALIPPTFYSPTLDDEYRTEYLTKKQDDKDDYMLGM